MRAAAFLLVLLTFVTFASGAAAQPVAPPAQPEQRHVTLGAEPGTLVVQWALAGVPYASPERPVVLWKNGADAEKSAPASLVGTVRAGSVNVQTQPGETFVYAATIGPVAPGSEVSYRTGTPERGFSSAAKVRMVPSANESLRFVAYGDIGYEGMTPAGTRDPAAAAHAPFQVRDKALADSPQLVVIPGDLSYVNSRVGWDRFMRFMEPLQSTVPTMPVIGNHEWDATLGYGQFLSEYVLPSSDEQNYVFRAGPVTFIAMNSDRICGGQSRGGGGSPPRPCGDPGDGAANQTSLAFLERALQEAQNDSTAWTIVYHHHPAYSFGRHGSDYAVQSLWAPLLEKYGADIDLTAHDHIYSRSHQLQSRRVIDNGSQLRQGQGVVYVVNGGGGRPLYDIPAGERPDWHASGGRLYHYSRWTANETELRYEAVNASSGAVFDSFTIRRAEPSSERAPGANAPVEPFVAALALAVGLLWRHRAQKRSP